MCVCLVCCVIRYRLNVDFLFAEFILSGLSLATLIFNIVLTFVSSVLFALVQFVFGMNQRQTGVAVLCNIATVVMVLHWWSKNGRD